MVQICFILAILCEMGMGILIINKIYPEFRFQNKIMKVLAVFLLGLAAYIYIWNSWLFYVSTTFIVIESVILTIVYWMFWESKFFNVFLLQMFYMVNLSMAKIPILTIKGIKYSENVISVNQGPRALMEVMYIILILFVVNKLIKKYRNVENILQKILMKHKLLLMLIDVLEWIMICYCMKIGHMEYEMTDFVLNVTIIVCIFMIMIVVTLFFAHQQIRNEKELQEKTYEYLKKQYYGLKDLYEINSRWVHDTKHQLIYVQSCLEEKNVSKAYESLQKYLQRIRKIEKKAWSNFSFLDFMINYKKAEMDKKEIKFVLNIELQHINIPEEDLVIILGNLLDNAIEAAEKCEKNERYINLGIYNRNNMLLMSIENSSNRIPKIEKGTFITSKPDKILHGLGTESVRELVNQYNGETLFEYTEKNFKVEILI